MSFNLNKYKLVKNVNQTNSNVNKTYITSSNNYAPESSSSLSLNFHSTKSIPNNSTAVLKNSSLFRLTNTNNKIIESSNKLDDLLKRCREIGTTSKSCSPRLSAPPQPRPTLLASKTNVPAPQPVPISTTQSTDTFKMRSKLKITVNNNTTTNQVKRLVETRKPPKPAMNSKYKLIKEPHAINSNIEKTTQLIHSNNSNKYKLNNKSSKNINNINNNNYSSKFKLINKSISNTKINKSKSYISKYKTSIYKIDKSKLINQYKMAYSFSNSKTRLVNNLIYKRTHLDINLFLGRQIENASKNKFKYINKTALLLIKNKKRKKASILNIKGVEFKLNKTGKKLSRLDNKINKQENKYKLVNNNNKKHLNNQQNQKLVFLASSLVNRSKMTIINRKSNQLKLNNKKDKHQLNNSNKKYCLFFNRFGRCSRGDSCPYTHDPKHVALCPRFLRGTCDVEQCPYSHTTSTEKIPLCSYFAAGCCNRENCPYSHVYYGKDAQFCVDFAKGYCSLGAKCDKPHINECPDFKANMACPRGKNCPLVHRKRKSKKLDEKADIKNKLENSSTNFSNLDLNNEESNNNKLDFKASFISFQQSNLNIETKIENLEVDKQPLKLRPSFATSK